MNFTDCSPWFFGHSKYSLAWQVEDTEHMLWGYSTCWRTLVDGNTKPWFLVHHPQCQSSQSVYPQEGTIASSPEVDTGSSFVVVMQW